MSYPQPQIGFARLRVVAMLVLFANLLGTFPAFAQSAASEANPYCFDGNCFATFDEAYSSAEAASGGYELIAEEQYLADAYPPYRNTPEVVYSYSSAMGPPAEFLASGYGPVAFRTSGRSSEISPCSSYGMPFEQAKCTSESQLVNQMSSYLEYVFNDGADYETTSLEGSWDLVYMLGGPGLGIIAIQPGLDDSYGAINWTGKKVNFTYKFPGNPQVHTGVWEVFRHDPFRCPVGRNVSVEGDAEFWDVDLAAVGWPNVCRDKRDYDITKKVDLGCGLCEEDGVDVSTGSNSVTEPLVSVDGADVDLTYSSTTRTWTPSFEKQIIPSSSAPLIEVTPGVYGRLKSIGASTYKVEGRPDELVFENPNGSYSYRTRGMEYRIDYEGVVAFGPIGSTLATVTRDGDTTVKTPNGRTITLSYDELSSRLISVSGGGETAELAHDSSGRLTGISWSSGAERAYLYGEPGLAAGGDNNLLTSILAEGGVLRATFGYDASGRATSRSTGSGTESETIGYAYPDSTHAVVALASGGTRSYEFTDDVYRRPLSIADGSSETVNQYDSESRLTAQTDRRGTTTLFAYTGTYQSARTEASGTAEQRRVETDRNAKFGGITARRVYDATGTLVGKHAWTYNARGQEITASVVDPSSGAARTTTSTYCETAGVTAGTCPRVGLLIKQDGPKTGALDITTFTYRQANGPNCGPASTTCAYRKGDLWKVTNALGHVTEILAYDRAGRSLSVKDLNGVIVDREYHARGWATAYKRRGGNDLVETDDAITRFEHWPNGLMKKITDPDGAFTSYAYDAARRLTAITDNSGNQIVYVLDGAGNRVQEDTKDQGGVLKRTLSRVFNQLGQLEVQADADANPTDFTYDDGGFASTITDARNVVTESEYDPLGRLARNVQAVGLINAQTEWNYDARNNLVQVSDPKNLSTDYTYDGMGDLTGVGSPDTGTTSFTYDSAGNRQTQTDARSQVSTYSYDLLNRATAIDYSATTQDVAYAYDTVQSVCTSGENFSKGKLTSISDASGSTQYCYDRFGNMVRKVQTTNGLALMVRYAYTRGGRLSTMTYPDGAVVDYIRDAQGRVSQVNATPVGTATQVLVRELTYAPFGPSTGWTYGNGRTLLRPINQNYQPSGIRDAKSGGLDVGYEYDAVGNLARLTLAANPLPLVKFDYDPLNRLTNFIDGPTDVVLESYTYDATGNRLSFSDSGGTDLYTYSPTSHRLAVVAGTSRTYDEVGNTTGVGGLAKEFGYDSAGRMSQVKSNQIVLMNYAYNGRGQQVRKHLGIENVYSVYDESGRWIGDYGNSGVPQQQAIWLDDLPVGLLVGGALQQLHYLQPDALGTPRVVIDPVRDVAVWKWDALSEAFGNTMPNQDPDGDASEFVLNMRYAGQRFDAASGAIQNGFRDYDAASGRYLTSDPIGLKGGVSTYGYALQNPLNTIDPSGLAAYLAPLPAPSDIPAGSIYCVDGVIKPYYNYSRWPKQFFECKELSDCLAVHEMSHVADANRTSPGLCQTAPLHFLFGTPPKSVTFPNDPYPGSNYGELDVSEFKAHEVELNCLVGKLKGLAGQCDDKCRAAVIHRIGQIREGSLPALRDGSYYDR